MKNSNRVLCLVLALVMAVGVLAGCTAKNGNDPSVPSGDNSSAPKPEDNPAISDPEGYSYVSTYTKLDLNTDQYIYNVRYAAGRLWYTTDEWTSDYVYNEAGEIVEDNGSSKTYLWSMNLDGSDARRIDNFEPQLPEGEGWSTYTYIGNIKDAGEGNLWLLENYNCNRNTAPEGIEPYTDEWYNYQEYKNGVYLIKIDPDGNTIAVLDPAALVGNTDTYFYVNDICVTDDGRLVVFSDMSGYVISAEGELLGTITADTYLGNIAVLKDGTMVTRVYEYDDLTQTGRETVRIIDIDNFKIGDEASFELPTSGFAILTGTGEYDLYCITSSGINGFRIADNSSEEIVNFINCDIDISNMNSSAIIPMEDGSFYAFSSEWTESGQNYSSVSIHKVKNSEIPIKKTLTFACMYLNYNVRRQILEFNRNSSEYRIKVIDYSQYNTNDDYEAGLTKLTTELLAGNIPDMFDTAQLPISRLAAKGYLEDLTPFIEGDSELGGMAGLVKPIIDAAKMADGKLYYTVPTAYLTTVMAPTKLVGDLVRQNPDGSVYWTIDDLMTAYSRMPAGADIYNQYTSASDMLSELTGCVIDDLINWSTGECRFNSPDFIAVLEFSNLFRKTPYDWEKEYDPSVDDSEPARFREGRQMLFPTQITEFGDWRQYDRLFGGATFVGIPVSGGSGNVWNISNNGTIAMSSRCSDKQGAWSFMRYFLSEEFQNDNYGIPTNKKVFDKKMEEMCTPDYEDQYDENGNVIGKIETPKSWYWYSEYQNGGGILYVDDVAIPTAQTSIIKTGTVTGPSEQYPAEQCFFAMTPEERAKLESVINSTTRLATVDQSILDIIAEEAAPYFDGKQTAEQTADTIQRRINLYVNEQR